MGEKAEVPGRMGSLVMWLPCRLTEGEVKEAGKTLAESLRRLDEAEERKKAFHSGIKSEILKIMGDVEESRSKVSTETAYRNIQCEVLFFFKRGEKEFHRTDTGELVKTEKITDEERQLKVAGA
jgi:hypothetical protein